MLVLVRGVRVGAGVDDDVAMGVDDVAVLVLMWVCGVGVGADDNAVVVNDSVDEGV